MLIGIKPDGEGGVKSFDLDMGGDLLWRQIAESQGRDPSALRAVDWMFRCVTIISGTAGSVPYTIGRANSDAEPIYDSDKDDTYPTSLELYEPLDAALGKMFTSYTVLGRAYMLRQRNASKLPVGLRYLNPATITPIINANGLVGFDRMLANGVRDRLPPDDVLYLWYPDETVELGEPNIYPGKAALAAAGVIMEMDTFLANYFARGMVKATVLMTKGNVIEAEKEKFRDWFRRVSGGNKKAFATEIINGDVGSIVPIGEGINELGNNELTQEKREGISTALGVPHSLVMSNAANYATAEQDVLNLYQNTIIPLCRQIQRDLNTQLFTPLGYQFKFAFERIEAVQKSELAKAAMVQALVGHPVLTVNEGRELLGYDPVPDGDELIKPQPEQLGAGQQLLDPPSLPKGNSPDMAQDMKSLELEKLGRYIRNGTYLARPFRSDVLTPDEIEGAIIAHNWQDYP